MAAWNPNPFRAMMGSRSRAEQSGFIRDIPRGGFPGGIREGNWNGGAMLRPPGGGGNYNPAPIRGLPRGGWQIEPPGFGRPLPPGGNFGNIPIRIPEQPRFPGFPGGGGAMPRYPGPGNGNIYIDPREGFGGGGGWQRYPGNPGGGMIGYPGYGGYPGGYSGQAGTISGAADPFLQFIRQQYGQGMTGPFGG